MNCAAENPSTVSFKDIEDSVTAQQPVRSAGRSTWAIVADVFRGDVLLQISAGWSCVLVAVCIGFLIAKPDFGCSESFLPEQHLLQAWICGGAMGALLLHGLNALTSRRMVRDPCAWYCLLILVNAAIRFLVPTFGRENLVCVVPLGGLGGNARAYSILTWLFWATTAPAMISLLAALSGSFKQQKRAFALTALSLTCGSIGTFMQTFAAWIVLLLIAFTSLAFVIYYMLIFARRGLARTRDVVSRRLWLAMLPAGVGVWLAIPLVWFLGQLNLISMQVEIDLLSIVDYLVKLTYVVLHIGSVSYQKVLEEQAEITLAEAARLRAEASNQAKRQFLRWIGHESRVPLQAGLLALEELQAGFAAKELIVAGMHPQRSQIGADAPGRRRRRQTPESLWRGFADAADTALRSIGAVGKLLDDFLSIAKIEDGRMDLEPVRFGVRKWLLDTAALFANALKKKRIRLRIVAAKSVPKEVIADDNRLRQVVSNYISNAIKFSPSGGEIVIRTTVVQRRPIIAVGNSDEALTLSAQSHVPAGGSASGTHDTPGAAHTASSHTHSKAAASAGGSGPARPVVVKLQATSNSGSSGHGSGSVGSIPGRISPAPASLLPGTPLPGTAVAALVTPIRGSSLTRGDSGAANTESSVVILDRRFASMMSRTGSVNADGADAGRSGSLPVTPGVPLVAGPSQAGSGGDAGSDGAGVAAQQVGGIDSPTRPALASAVSLSAAAAGAPSTPSHGQAMPSAGSALASVGRSPLAGLASAIPGLTSLTAIFARSPSRAGDISSVPASSPSRAANGAAVAPIDAAIGVSPSRRHAALAAAAAADVIGPAESSTGSTASIARQGDVLVPFLRVTVEDRGSGLTHDEIGKLFHAYSQIRAGVNQSGGGTGLGLVNCKRIVELAGGTVGVTSTPGVRTTFYMEIPLVLPQDGGLAAALSQDQADLQVVARRVAEAGRQAENAANRRQSGTWGSGDGGGSPTAGRDISDSAVAISVRSANSGGPGAVESTSAGAGASPLQPSPATGTGTTGTSPFVMGVSRGALAPLAFASAFSASGVIVGTASPSQAASSPLAQAQAQPQAGPASSSLSVTPVPADPTLLVAAFSGIADAESSDGLARPGPGYGGWVSGEGRELATTGSSAQRAGVSAAAAAAGHTIAASAAALNPASGSPAARQHRAAGADDAAQLEADDDDAEEELAVVGESELGSQGDRERISEADSLRERYRDGHEVRTDASRPGSSLKGTDAPPPSNPAAAPPLPGAGSAPGATREHRHDSELDSDTRETRSTGDASSSGNGPSGSPSSSQWRNGTQEAADADGDPETADSVVQVQHAVSSSNTSRRSSAQGAATRSSAAGLSTPKAAARASRTVSVALPGVPDGTSPAPAAAAPLADAGAADSRDNFGGAASGIAAGSAVSSPSARGAAQALLATAAAPDEAGDESSLYGQKTLLRAVVVDDVSTNRELFARMLRRNGVDVVFTAEDGQDCLNKLAEYLRSTGEAVPDTFPALAGSSGASLPSSPTSAASTPGGKNARTPVMSRISSAFSSPSGSGGTTPQAANTAAAPASTVPPAAAASFSPLGSPTPAAASSEHSIGAVIDRNIQAFFVDSSMPIMDGPELAKRLRALGCTNPIFGVTGNALAEDRAEFVRAGASYVLIKPCTGQHLREAVASMGLAFP